MAEPRKEHDEDARALDPIIAPFINSPSSTIGLGPISPASLLDDGEEDENKNKKLEIHDPKLP